MRSGTAAALCVAVAGAAAFYLALTGGRTGGPLVWAVLATHAVAPAIALALLRAQVPARIWRGAWVAVLVSLGCGLGGLWPGLGREVRAGLIWLHVLGGAAALVVPAVTAVAGRWRLQRYAVGTLCLALLLGPVGLYLAGERSVWAWQPRKYDSAACYRFLTATTAEQAGSPGFPSALRVEGTLERGCGQSGCHAGIAERAGSSGHLRGAEGAAYRATLADFTVRRGETAARWCRGCHEPEAATRNVSCAACHSAVAVNGGYGAAALTLEGGRGRGETATDVRLRPYAHAARFSNPGLLKSAEFCGSCHRKHWSLPQNEYRWMEGPDELRSWQASHFSGSALFAPGDRQAARSCISCHDPHGGSQPPGKRPASLALDIQVRTPGEEAGAPGTGGPAPAQMDVVVTNSGIGHDFPYGMPDLHEAWLEVSVVDSRGRRIAHSGGIGADGKLDPEAHVYRLVGVNRKGEAIRHGNLDEMVSVREWRRIHPGQSDLARYALPARVPAGSRVEVRLLRRRRPDFRKWAGEETGSVEVLAVAARGLREPGGSGVGGSSSSSRTSSEPSPAELRRYGAALAAVKAYPEALRVLLRARGIDAADGETDLALGRVYLLEGDLLAARDAFLRVAARPADGTEEGVSSHDRARAWGAAVLRRTGQSDEAARVLAELARRYPRDRQLRFELGLTRMALLDHAAAAREFEAALDVDPLDAAAHYNLMISLQRLNQVTRARREETLYRLLSDSAPLPVAQPRRGGDAREASPLHVHRMNDER